MTTIVTQYNTLGSIPAILKEAWIQACQTRWKMNREEVETTLHNEETKYVKYFISTNKKGVFLGGAMFVRQDNARVKHYSISMAVNNEAKTIDIASVEAAYTFSRRVRLPIVFEAEPSEIRRFSRVFSKLIQSGNWKTAESLIYSSYRICYVHGQKLISVERTSVVGSKRVSKFTTYAYKAFDVKPQGATLDNEFVSIFDFKSAQDLDAHIAQANLGQATIQDPQTRFALVRS